MGQELKAGDVLSYSAGTKQTGPDGYRVIQTGRGVLARTLMVREPQLIMHYQGCPIRINAYPAPAGDFPFGITVDTYMSKNTALRALKLAAREGKGIILSGQPLFLAHILMDCDVNLRSLLIISGGYPMPKSLETFIRSRQIAPVIDFLYLFGVAELDAGMLYATQWTSDNALKYRLRGEDVGFKEVDGTIRIQLNATGQVTDGSDQIQLIDSESCEVFPKRVAPGVRNTLESWGTEEWHQFSGYIISNGRNREWHRRGSPEPSMMWLSKPDWSAL
jgi:hypothetical protein